MSRARTGYARLEDRIDWYDRKSLHHQVWYRRLKVVSIASATLVSSLDEKSAGSSQPSLD